MKKEHSGSMRHRTVRLIFTVLLLLFVLVILTATKRININQYLAAGYSVRGVDVAAAVGIVEKLIGFFFLVPSAMLSSVSAIASQNAGAGKHEQADQVMRHGIGISVCFGLAVAFVCQFAAEALVGLFAGEEPEVIRLGGQYLRYYVFDCAAAGIHFCFSGYFCAYGKSVLSFVHNVASALLVRILGAYLASLYFPESLYPMGWATPAGSLLSVVICVIFYMRGRRKGSNVL